MKENSSALSVSTKEAISFRLRRISSIVVLAIFALVAIGCSKDESSSASSQPTSKTAKSVQPAEKLVLLEQAILEALPEDAALFMVTDTSGPAYKAAVKRLYASGAGADFQSQINSLLSSSGFEDPKMKSVLSFILDFSSTLQEVGLYPKSETDLGGLSSGIAYLQLVSGNPIPQVSSIGLLNANVDGSKALDALVKVYNKHDFKSEKKDFFGVSGHSIVIEGIGTFNLVAKGDKLIGSTQESEIERLLKFEVGNATRGRRDVLAKDSRIQKLTNRLMSQANVYIFAFADLEKAMSFAKPLVAVTGAPTDAIDNSPLQAASYVVGLDEQSIAIYVDPKTPSQKTVFKSLEQSTNTHSFLGAQPSDSLISLNISTKSLVGLLDSLSADQPDLLPINAKDIPLFNDMSSATITLKGPSSAMPMPDFGLTFNSSNSGKLAKDFKDMLGMLMAGQGMGDALSWNKKNLAGVDVESAMSPLGFGATLGSKGDRVVLASSEGLFSSLIASSSNSLMSKVGKLSRADSTAFVSVYVDFLGLTNTLKTLEGSLAMLTGGQEIIPADQVEAMKAMGAILITASYQDGILDISSKTHL